jgi:hypothetical protein
MAECFDTALDHTSAARSNHASSWAQARKDSKMSWKSEVIADNNGKWSGNALRFATQDEAERYVADLFQRWTLVRETRVVECDDPVNYAIVDGKLQVVSVQPHEGECRQ